MNLNNFYSLESEQMVLSCLMVYNNSWSNIYTFLTIENFFFNNHKKIFSIILEFLNLNINFDIISIWNRLKHLKNFDYLNYLNYLIQKLPNPINNFFFSRVIHNMCIMRKILYTINNFTKNMLEINDLNLTSLLEDIESNVFNINKNYINIKNNLNLIGDVFKSYIDNKIKIDDNIFLTGFKNLDKLIKGICRGDLVILAGRPSMGKTSFSLNIIKNISDFYNIPIIIFSMEMSIDQLLIRILSLFLDKSNNEVYEYLNNIDFIKQNESLINKINYSKIFIDESSNLTVLQIYTKCKLIIKEYGNLGIIVIDYLQLMSSSNFNQNRVLEISEISRSLKCLAKELNIPVLAISQLNRNLESRGNKRPVISDLRESGAIEQDADIIIFVYREGVYDSEKIKNNNSLAEIIIGKHRNGSTGKIFLNFFDEKSKFLDSIN